MIQRTEPFIFFDAAGTLIRLVRGVGMEYSEVLARHQISLEPDRLQAAFLQEWKGMPPQTPTGRPRNGEDAEWWKELVFRVLDRCGDHSEARLREAAFHDLYQRFAEPGVWELYPEVHAVLTRLRQMGCRIGVLSNFDGRLHTIFKHLGLERTFDLVLISAEAGYDKPHPGIFRKAEGLTGSRQPWHVGDDPEADWQGAKLAGWKWFELRRPANDLRALVGVLEQHSRDFTI